MIKCANYMNQEAIDLAIREANERLRRLDIASGMKDPPDQYTEGTNCCRECHDASLPDQLNDYLNMVAGRDIGFHRVCYKPIETKESVVNGQTKGIVKKCPSCGQPMDLVKFPYVPEPYWVCLCPYLIGYSSPEASELEEVEVE